MTEGPKVVEPGGDIDVSDENSSTWNRAATGMLDLPVEVELTEVDVLIVIAAEQVVLNELTHMLTFEWWWFQ